MQRVGVRGRVDGDRLDVDLVQRTDHADGDLAAVGDEDPLEHQTASSGGGPTGSSSNSSWPNSTGSALPTWIVRTIAGRVGLDLVHQLHRLEDAERLARRDRVAFLHERRRARLGRAVEDADHRRLDAHEAVGLRRRGRRQLTVVRGLCRDRGQGRLELLGRAAHRDAHAGLLDRDLPDAGLLDDADDLADPLGARLVDAAGAQGLVAAGAPADRLQQRLRLVAEEREQEQLLLARGEPVGLVAERLEVDGRLFLRRAVRESVTARLTVGSIGPGGVP